MQPLCMGPTWGAPSHPAGQPVLIPDYLLETITGHIERITFHNPENGWTVARLQEAGKAELTTVVGTLSSVQCGETLRCAGTWKNDHQFGIQFIVRSYEVTRPASLRGIQKYLASGMIRGIGAHFSERMVACFGEDTLHVIDKTPERLLDIEGIGPRRLARIVEGWREQQAVREVMTFLLGHGVSPTYALKVYRTYGDDSIAVLQSNPYQLARDIWGIGFKTADAMARQMGIRKDAVERVDAGIEYCLHELSNDGHTCYPLDAFLDTARQLLECEANQVAERLAVIESEGRIVSAPLSVDGQAPVACVWLKSLYACETGIAAELHRLTSSVAPELPFETGHAVDHATETLGMELAPNQRAAVESSLREKVHIITGGPGTGKSTITKVILQVSREGTTRILLTAPTGRAARRLAAITGMPAATIHSLLEFDFAIGGFRRNRDHPLACDLLVVDEVSMVDTTLMFSLLKAVPAHARLLLVGDVDQLPSVGAGNVLADLIRSGKIPCTRLTDVFRQAATSQIIRNAHRINQGIFPDLSNDRQGDFFFLEEEHPDKLTDLIVNLVDSRLPAAYGFDSFDDIQVLAPMNRGVIGNRNLNEHLQRKLNPSPDPLVKMGRTFHEEDKVMQVRNNYAKEVSNGDIGRIRRIDRTEQEVSVSFDGHEVRYDFADLDQLTLAYSVSIHKFQGSECPCVLIPLVMGHYAMLYRNLLYTGITRGKRLVVLAGSRKALWMAVRNDTALRRYTGLAKALLG